MPDKEVLPPAVLAIDPQHSCAILEDFIRTTWRASKKHGILVTVSGGLDSSVVAALVVRAIGPEQVTGLMLPERCGNPTANRLGKLLIDQLQIKAKVIHINPVLRGLGISSALLALFGGRAFWKKERTRIQERQGAGVHAGYLSMLRGEAAHTFRKYAPKINGRQRARLLYACKYAEEHQLLLAGATHRTERSVGLFAKFGIDDSADIMPLKNLYRSQVLQLGAYLGLPAAILDRAPNPDMVPGVTDKYRSYLGLDAAILDLILVGLSRNMDPSDIAEQLHLSLEKIEEIREIQLLTEQQRHPSLAPSFDPS